MRIDSHQHFWNYDSSMEWIQDNMKDIRRNFVPEDLRQILSDQKMDGCILVQVNQHLQENEYMLNFTKDYTFIKGVVGWADFCSETVREVLERYSNQPLLKGFRHILQGESDENFMLGKNFTNGISQLRDFNFTYDLLISSKHLSPSLTLAKQFPNQKFVVDHIAKPEIRNGKFKEWEDGIKAMAKCDNVWCKLSGMVTEADWKDWKTQDILPYMEVVLESFGPSRIMYGSDWPVCLVAASYEQTTQLVENFIQKLSASEQEYIMGKTAMEFYNLKKDGFTTHN